MHPFLRSLWIAGLFSIGLLLFTLLSSTIATGNFLWTGIQGDAPSQAFLHKLSKELAHSDKIPTNTEETLPLRSLYWLFILNLALTVGLFFFFFLRILFFSMRLRLSLRRLYNETYPTAPATPKEK